MPSTLIFPVTSNPDGHQAHLRALLAFLAVYCAVMLTFATIAGGWGALHPDMTETWAWGKEFQLGYSKHPPIMAWMAGVWFELMPRTDWSFYLLAIANAGIGLAGVWMLAGLLLGVHGRWVSVLFLVLTPSYTFWALKFNANAVLLSSWPWTAYFFVQSLRSRGAAHALLAGIAGAVAMLGKYYSGVLLATLFVAALLYPDRGRYFRSWAPWLTAVAGLAALAPHLWWLCEADFPTFQYALSKTRYPVAEAGQHTLSAIAQSYLCLGLGAAALGAAFGRRSWHLLKRSARAAAKRDTAWLIWLAHGPAIVTLAAFVVSNGRFATEHLMPACFAMPVAFLAASHAPITGLVVRRLTLAVAALWLPITLASPVLASYSFAHAAALEPRRELAVAVTQMWNGLFHRPLRFVAGTEALATATTFYSPDAPSYLMLDKPALTPWVDAERLKREGLFILCRVSDRACIAHAQQLIGDRPFRKTQEFAASYRGRSSPPRAFTLFILPPAGADFLD
ncbi:MAG TPA: glycosyltransferase family 39 protein [Hyphomicrobiaceae bacterium]|jgi:4-amino-4-deoxy-L-arabinose transferase-like glycosyltransferase